MFSVAAPGLRSGSKRWTSKKIFCLSIIDFPVAHSIPSYLIVGSSNGILLSGFSELTRVKSITLNHVSIDIFFTLFSNMVLIVATLAP